MFFWRGGGLLWTNTNPKSQVLGKFFSLEGGGVNLDTTFLNYLEWGHTGILPPSQTWNLNVQGSLLQVWDLTVQEPFVVFILIATVSWTILMINISMHSSRMRTACLLTVSQHALHRGVFPQHVLGRGMCAQGGAWQSPPLGQNDRQV